MRVILLDKEDKTDSIVDNRLTSTMRGLMASNNVNDPGKEWNRLEIKSLTAVVLDDIRRRILTGGFRPGYGSKNNR